MLEECAKRLPCSGGNVEKQAEWYRPVLPCFVSSLSEHKRPNGKEIVTKKNYRERIEVKRKNDR